METILQFKAWDVSMYSDEENILCTHNRSLKIRNLLRNNIIANRNVSKDYYVSIYIIETKEVVIAMGKKKNQIDILALNNLSMIESIKWKESKKYLREKCVIDEEKENIYSVLYADELKKTIVTKFNIETRKEEILSEFQNRYIFDILYLKEEKTCLIGGIHFYDKDKNGVVGEYEIFSLNDFTGRTILKEMAKSSFAHLEKIGRNEKNEILICYSDLRGIIIHNLTQNKDIMVLSHDAYVSFSEKGKYIAYTKDEKTQLKIYLYSITSRKVVDEYDVIYSGLNLVRCFQFQVEDKYITFQENEITYIVKI